MMYGQKYDVIKHIKQQRAVHPNLSDDSMVLKCQNQRVLKSQNKRNPI